MSSIVKVDTIQENTSANGITVDGLNIKDSKLVTANSVIETNLTDNIVTLAKMASGTDGNIISYDASGNPVAIATGNDGQVLTSAGAGQPPAFEAIPGGGKIGQVLQAVKLDTFTCTSASFVDITGLSVAITPSATSSKILIMSSVNGGAANEIHLHFKLLRGSTDILKGNAASNRIRSSISLGPIRNTSQSENFSIQFLDSPSSTDQQTYKIQMQNQGGSVTSHINRSGSDGDNTTFSRNTSSITVMEVLA